MTVHSSSSQPLKILFLAAECAPFFKVGGLADVVGSLPQALRQLGHEVRVMLPRYRPINGQHYGLKRIADTIDVPTGTTFRTTEVVKSNYTGVPTYFIWDERFFGRNQVYGQPDEAMAFVFFCRAAIEFLRAIDWTPDIIHCHDWHTGCALMYLDLRCKRDPRLRSIARVFTIHNLVYQGTSGDALFRFAGFGEYPKHITGEQPGTANWMARGIAHADVINTVSPTYAAEILTPEVGAGLDTLLRSRRGRVSGILNGIDRDEWNPSTDPALAARFDSQSIKRRATNKKAVQEQLGLKRKPRLPLIGMVTRLVEQKGFDIILAAAERLMERDMQLVVLGSGEPHYEAALQELHDRYPGRVGIEYNFNDPLARLIYGGSDLFLMPSQFEPGGLGQMIAMRYGSLPLVRATGGLADTVTDAGRASKHGNGFSFKPYLPQALIGAVDRALKVYAQPERWIDLQQRAMAADFSWSQSAEQYVALYRKALVVHTK